MTYLQIRKNWRVEFAFVANFKINGSFHSSPTIRNFLIRQRWNLPFTCCSRILSLKDLPIVITRSGKQMLQTLSFPWGARTLQRSPVDIFTTSCCNKDCKSFGLICLLGFFTWHFSLYQVESLVLQTRYSNLNFQQDQRFCLDIRCICAVCISDRNSNDEFWWH